MKTDQQLADEALGREAEGYEVEFLKESGML